MLKYISIIVFVVLLASALVPIVFAQGKTREEMIEWIADLDKRDAELLQQDAKYQVEINGITSERLELWDTETVLGKVAEWKIKHLKDEGKKAKVREAYQEALKYIDVIWENAGDGTGSTTFGGTEIIDLIRRQIALWLLPDDEYDEWMASWSNAKLIFQGRIIPLTSGMAHAKLRKDDSSVSFLLKRENCFTIDGEKYALVERNYVAGVTDDHYRVYLYRLDSNGMAILIEEVIREHFASEMKLFKEMEGCLQLDWKYLEEDKKESTWILLLE
ncbi:MAG: hypothetical protein IKS92_04195 [Victivallales bacterium]|nr:hypothetical protein [Victivallales bacterium]MBR5025944.1 hypothetical protein [Victivallales bacterium]